MKKNSFAWRFVKAEVGYSQEVFQQAVVRKAVLALRGRRIMKTVFFFKLVMAK